VQNSAAAGAVEDREEENDDDDPDKGIVFKNVAEASHDMNLRFFHFV